MKPQSHLDTLFFIEKEVKRFLIITLLRAPVSQW